MLLDAGSRSGCSLLECVTDQAIESPSAKGERCSIFCAQFGIFAGGKTPGNYLDAVLIERATGRPSCLVHVRGDAKDDLRKHCKLCMTKRSSCWIDRDCFVFFVFFARVSMAMPVDAACLSALSHSHCCSTSSFSWPAATSTLRSWEAA